MRKVVVPILFGVTIFFSLLQPAFSLDGTDWKSLGEAARNYYVAGVMDGWVNVLTLAEVGQTEHKLEPSPGESILMNLLSCITKRGMKYPQVVAVVDKYMAAHPELWHHSLASSVFGAIWTSVCNK